MACIKKTKVSKHYGVINMNGTKMPSTKSFTIYMSRR